MKTLTKRQADVLRKITQFVRAAGHAPTYRQIGVLVGISSSATVYKHVSNLQRKGYLIREFNRQGMELKRVRGLKCCPTCGHRKEGFSKRMKQSIRKGLATPVSECSTELAWK